MRYAVRILNEYDVEADSPDKAMTIALRFEANGVLGRKELSVQSWDDGKETEE